ncbi:hypothetical protein [Streptomyces sp. NBC_00847]|uniref:hypothetical protein n=1 Tax=Streptomyces sp. NBC_00847 TaxID=2975850 RepID=UPI002258111D|nr:hypothetical protein [Streptomyces sp. NBC_00847]MCX4881455.1 hypothetical protein [Streptomyces sp. NBC_00847]
MNDDGNFAHNVAADGSMVAVQASVVRDSNISFNNYQDVSPQEKYKIGVRYLKDGVPSRARDLISEAIARGHDNAEVRFHWVLAMLSARAYHDLSTEELQRLHHASGLMGNYAEGEWKDALRVTLELLAMLGTADGETGRVLEQLRSLSDHRRDQILHHLDLVLTGGLKDSLWTEYRTRAGEGRFDNDRVNRVWAYFEPEPIGPRAQPPRASTAEGAEAAFPFLAGGFVLATAVLCTLALFADPASAVVELLLALGAGAIAVRFGRQWAEKDLRLKAEDRAPGSPHAEPPVQVNDGFTNDVRQAFQYYFGNRVPHGLAPNEWFGLTTPIRDGLAAEIALLYRESRVGVDRVDWLIRFLAEDARDRYSKGTLFDQRHLRQSVAMAKALCVLALMALGIMALVVFGTVASAAGGSQILLAILAVIGAVWSGRRAVSSWLEVQGEEHRLAVETREYQEQLTARQVAYQDWKSYLDATRPSELEMETWLTCDKTVFVDEALRHYQLTWRDLITHTILMTPARPYKRGRVKGGPWRYSRYSFRLFLITQDGVREISTDFDFADAKRGNEQRSNYRFDALSSVQVTEHTRVGYDLELVLTNGPARKIRVKDADTHQLAPDENAQEITEINLSSAGFIHTFRLLEGIAADGKGWIERNNPNNLPSFGAAN